MSVLIKDMEKPRYCYEVVDGKSKHCPFVNPYDNCILLLKQGICGETQEEMYSKCPLIEVSEPCKDEVSRSEVFNITEYVAHDVDALVDSWYKLVNSEVRVLPPVQPEKEIPKRVRWSGCKGTRYSYTGYFCPNCETSVRDDDCYCHRCGQKIIFSKITYTPYVPGEKQQMIVTCEDENV